MSLYRKDVRLPQQLQRAMAAEAEAAREARAKVFNPFENFDFIDFLKLTITSRFLLNSNQERKWPYFYSR